MIAFTRIAVFIQVRAETNEFRPFASTPPFRRKIERPPGFASLRPLLPQQATDITAFAGSANILPVDVVL